MPTNNINTVLDQEWSFESSVYVPTGVSDLSTGTPTVVDLTLDEGGTGLANLAAINSDQVDLGLILPLRIDIIAAIEWFAAIVAGNSVDFYWAESANSNVAAGNPGKPDGVDGLYTGDGGGTVPESVLQITPVGSLITTDLQGVQIAKIGSFVPVFQFGQLIVVNNSGTTLCGTDDVESSILFRGTMPQFQPDVA